MPFDFSLRIPDLYRSFPPLGDLVVRDTTLGGYMTHESGNVLNRQQDRILRRSIPEFLNQHQEFVPIALNLGFPTFDCSPCIHQRAGPYCLRILLHGAINNLVHLE